MRINTLINSDLDEQYSSHEFLNDALLYSDYYKRNFKDKVLTASASDAYSFQGNLFALFKVLGIPDYLHVLVMAYNGIATPVEYDGIQTAFNMPAENIYNRLHNLT